MENHNPAKELIIAFISALVLVYILAHFVQYTKAEQPSMESKPPFGYGLVS